MKGLENNAAELFRADGPGAQSLAERHPVRTSEQISVWHT